ncbi:MAG TPA: hypothetical protein VNW52_00775 [Burkholderiaceae bacterium]|jgi:hypothetical protein|nr:hypothetical protein [Burkholderiaceae bacterium]
MATASKATAKFNPNQFAEVVRASALRILESVQTKLDQTQEEGRIVLSQQVLKSANRASDLSKALTVLSEKIAPVSKPKAKAAPKAKAKPVAKKTAVKVAVKAAAKPRARKVAVAA